MKKVRITEDFSNVNEIINTLKESEDTQYKITFNVVEHDKSSNTYIEYIKLFDTADNAIEFIEMISSVWYTAYNIGHDDGYRYFEEASN